MKRLTLLAAALPLMVWIGCAPDGPGYGDEAVAPAKPEGRWLTNYEEALRLAAEQGKPVLINFTGSDWCPPCQTLKRDTFDKADFADYASENLILLEIDFPRAKRQPAELEEQNKQLSQQYTIQAYPTLVLLDSEGREIRRAPRDLADVSADLGPILLGGPPALVEWIEG